MTRRRGVVFVLVVLVDAALFLSARFLSIWWGLALAFAVVASVWRTLPNRAWHYRFSRSDLGLSFGAFGLLLAIAAAARIVDGGFDLAYAAAVHLTETERLLPFFGIVTIVVAKEEIFLRVLQSYLLRWPVWFGAVLLSLNFALLHTPFYAPQHTAIVWGAILTSSFVLALLFAATRNIAMTLFVHIFVDALLLVQIVLHVLHPAIEAWFWVFATLVIVVSARRMRQLLRTVPPERVAGGTLVLGVIVSAVVGAVLLLR